MSTGVCSRNTSCFMTTSIYNILKYSHKLIFSISSNNFAEPTCITVTIRKKLTRHCEAFSITFITSSPTLDQFR